MKSLKVLFLPIAFMSLMSACKKNTTTEFTLTLTPKTITALNAKVWTCADKEALKVDSTHTATGAAAAAQFKKMIITWKNTKADLLIYAMRITGKNADGSAIDITLAGQDFWAAVFGIVDTTKYCSFCSIAKTTDANPVWTQTVTEGETFINYLNTTTSGTGCGLSVTGISVPHNVTNDVTLSLKATLLAYSTDTDGNVNNEYATFPFYVKLQAPP